MRIKKTSQTTILPAQVVNTYDTSQENAYSCDYINDSDTYSTSEVKTNKTWINGKPIWRICITGTTPSTVNTYSNVTVGITNLDTIVAMYGNIVDANGYSKSMCLNNSEFDSSYRVSTDKFLTHPIISAYCNCSFTMVFEYTKTTD